MRNRTRKLSRGRVVFVVITAVIFGLGWWVRDVTMPPSTKSELEEKMDRPFLAYEVWDDTPIVVFQWTEDGEYVYIDRLRLDWMNMGVPFFPRWQWTGVWSYIESTSDPASLGYGHGAWGAALFGQINDPAITRARCSLEAAEITELVSAPGFAIQLPGDAKIPDSCDFLDASGAVIWTANVNKSEV